MSQLHALMERHQLSYRQLAYLTGLSAGFLCRVANGERRLSPEAAVRVARVLRTSPERVDGRGSAA